VPEFTNWIIFNFNISKHITVSVSYSVRGTLSYTPLLGAFLHFFMTIDALMKPGAKPQKTPNMAKHNIGRSNRKPQGTNGGYSSIGNSAANFNDRVASQKAGNKPANAIIHDTMDIPRNLIQLPATSFCIETAFTMKPRDIPPAIPPTIPS
jgi:hypothetical protein